MGTFVKLITTFAIAISTMSFAGTVIAAEPIVGTWLRPSTGTLVKFSGSGTYCGTVQNGEFRGKRIGCMKGSGSKYRGKITDLSNNKTYTGKASVNGNIMKLSGCIAGGLICRGENWKRQ